MDNLTLDIEYSFTDTPNTDICISSSLQKTNIEDLKAAIGDDIEGELEKMLSEELAKSIDKEILNGYQKMIFNETLEERKQNAKRRIILNRMFNQPPDYFKNH